MSRIRIQQPSSRVPKNGAGLRFADHRGIDIPVSSATKAGGGLRSGTCCLLIALFALLFVSSCRQDMQDQPKYKPYRASDFFSDGLSMRTPPAGTVARGFLKADTEFYTGKVARAQVTGQSPGQAGLQATGAQTGGTQTGGTQAGGPNELPDTTVFPFPVTEEVMTRGKERYEIYCSVCHGAAGYGDGMVTRRGYRRPPALTEQRLLDSPVGHYFDVITNGWGAMPSYSTQVAVEDRWAIIAYIRALQKSQVGITAQGTTQGANMAAPAASPSPGQAQTRQGGRR
jgi:mono/diheme cytochrome c family protein